MLKESKKPKDMFLDAHFNPRIESQKKQKFLSLLLSNE
jgi:hypothetical protein